MAAQFAIAAAGLGFLSGFQGAQAQNQSLEFQANQAEINADILLQEAGFTEKFAMSSELRFRQDSQRFLSAQKVRAAATGFSIEAGSIRELLVQSEVLAEADAFAIRFKGEFEAFKKRTTAVNLQRQAGLIRSSKQDPFLAGITSGASAGLPFLGK